MADYPSNARKAKAPKKEQAPAKRVAPLTAPADPKSPPKKHLGFIQSFLVQDIPSMLRYVKDDVLLPSIRKLCHDVITNGADAIFMGQDQAKQSKAPGSFFSYGSCYQSVNRASSVSSYQRAPEQTAYADVSFPSSGLANAALDQLWSCINQYGVARVGDLYDCAGLTPPFTSYNYGWTDISTAKVARNFDGTYGLRMPKAMPIDD